MYMFFINRFIIEKNIVAKNKAGRNHIAPILPPKSISPNLVHDPDAHILLVKSSAIFPVIDAIESSP